MNLFRTRSGITLLETILFLGILSIMAGTITSVYIATQDARQKQSAVEELESAGSELLMSLSKTMRRAESVVSPSANQSGTILVLQMASNDEFPTIVAKVGSGLVLAQKSATSALLTPSIIVTDLRFKNVGSSNVWFTFTLKTTVQTVKRQTYARTFNGTATLFPDDQSDAGGCGSCPSPSCINHAYTWYICSADVCSQSDTTIPC